MKIPINRELQQIVSNHWSYTELQDFMKFYKYYTKELFSFLVNDTTDEQVSPEKGVLEESAIIKRFEYSTLGIELKEQATIAKDQYKCLRSN